MNDEIKYFQTRVMRHITKDGAEEYAIHEVYFGQDDVVGLPVIDETI